MGSILHRTFKILAMVSRSVSNYCEDNHKISRYGKSYTASQERTPSLARRPPARTICDTCSSLRSLLVVYEDVAQIPNSSTTNHVSDSTSQKFAQTSHHRCSPKLPFSTLGYAPPLISAQSQSKVMGNEYKSCGISGCWKPPPTAGGDCNTDGCGWLSS